MCKDRHIQTKVSLFEVETGGDGAPVCTKYVEDVWVTHVILHDSGAISKVEIVPPDGFIYVKSKDSSLPRIIVVLDDTGDDK